MGDTIDNIKGVRGVGEKTAVKLIGQFGSVERLYENLTLVPGKLRETLATGRKDALLSRELALLNRQVPVALDLDAFRRVEPDWGKLRVLWMEMEFSRLVKELPPSPPPAAPEPSQLLEGPAAIAAWLGGVPAGAPLALDWAGESPPPEPRITGLAVFHPAAGAAELGAGEAPASLGARELIVHDAKPLIESWLARGVAPPPVHDSAVAAYLLNSARQSYRLEQVCMDAFGDCPPAADPTRALGVRATSVWRYWEHAAAELRARELWTIYEEIERPLVLVLALMERHGIRVDPGRLEAFAKELERDLDNLTREIYQLAGGEFTIASPKQLAQILFEKLKLPPVRRTKTGYSTDADVLSELALGHPLPAKILEHRSLAKLKGTYADTLPGLVNPRTGRIHTTFNQLVAATGRLSSQDPNLMNIPIRTELGRRIRGAFIARTLAEGRERGFVSTLLGRRRYLPDLKSGNPVARNAAERMAMNAPVQGSASDMIKIAMVRMQAALVARGLRARMLLQVHDELLFEAPMEEVDAVTALAREIMASALPLKVPVVVDVKTGDDWAQV